MIRFSMILALALLVAPVAAFADNQDEGLYDPVAPAGSAFVRFISVDPSLKDGDDSPTVNGKEYDSVPFATVSPYFVIPQGELKTTFHEASTTAKAKSGKFYTQVLRGDRIVTLTDTLADKNPNKAQVIFYNLSVHSAVSLKTADGSVAITQQPVKANSEAARSVNAIKLKSTVYAGDSKLTSVPSLVLERGKAYAIVLLSEADGEPKVVTALSRTDTNK